MDTNPYQAPREQQATVDQPDYPAVETSWRIIPAAIVGFLGVATMLIGLVMLGGTVLYLVYSFSANAPSQPPRIVICALQMLIAGMILGAGFLWMTSALAFWRCRWESACRRFVLGFGILAIPVFLMVLAILDLSL